MNYISLHFIYYNKKIQFISFNPNTLFKLANTIISLPNENITIYDISILHNKLRIINKFKYIDNR